MIELLKQEGHTITSREIVPDDSKLIREKVIAACENPDVDVILTNGGTGISFRDVTIETIANILDKEIPGFVELFRVISYQEDICSSALMSRAIAGVSHHTATFTTPRSTGAVNLAMNKLLLPELSHVLPEITKDIEERYRPHRVGVIFSAFFKYN